MNLNNLTDAQVAGYAILSMLALICWGFLCASIGEELGSIGIGLTILLFPLLLMAIYLII